MLINLLVIGIGGFIGAVSRYFISWFIGQRWGRSFPLGTLAVNVIGCFIIGFAMSLFMEKIFISSRWRAFVLVGFVGSFTTFSTFEYETAALVQDGEWMLALLNIGLSLFLGFMALKIGQAMARSI